MAYMKKKQGAVVVWHAGVRGVQEGWGRKTWKVREEMAHTALAESGNGMLGCCSLLPQKERCGSFVAGLNKGLKIGTINCCHHWLCSSCCRCCRSLLLQKERRGGFVAGLNAKRRGGDKMELLMRAQRRMEENGLK
jgi:hypothetical protein